MSRQHFERAAVAALLAVLGLAMASSAQEDLPRGSLSDELGASLGPQVDPSGWCNCACRPVNRATGRETSPAELMDGDAELACSKCCEGQELVEAMAPYLPVNRRTTTDREACNEPSGLLSIFLRKKCWSVPAGKACEFPFIVGYNQVVVDCTETGEDAPWCVYDYDAWNEKGQGWGYCAPKRITPALGAISNSTTASNSTAAPGSDSLDKIIANLTSNQEASLAAYEESTFDEVKNSDGLTTAGIAVVTVVCVLIVGIFVLSGFVIWRYRNRIKQRRMHTFHDMDKPGSPGKAEVAMNPL
ncbi:hypothetical protein HKI87_13g75150 [Chloropicon roscoffensis]|uniref:Uncharacterized protein n=1 Tax=Chloropicon roscoffensis TaxID=1461544 RepID=A0AAX4PIC2_9CHLO|eukprot:CAMPEP_0198462450 /NCGR_PEP_ID=MMETSP1456-20131121/928_1 /TAXON_ID=1461544 ORGANISM="Unidentified sp., Strain RCC1871" /NCGR_SAMPLE_ID=MMETSP1456 /ASSEMBLY_ACC=CAM_ASM_001119 /LENGTH=300 /DNA_ID=CAMNT_0044187653 /DNA_START=97 /DNA_END=999 /DNA_ORIENTATION=+